MQTARWKTWARQNFSMTRARLALQISLLFPLILHLPACGNENPNTTPPTPSATATVELTDAAPLTIPSASAAPTASVAISDPPPPAEADECAGADLDLAAVLANHRCHTRRDAPPTPPNASSVIKTSLTPSSASVAPGGHVDLNLEIVNSGSVPIPLYFGGDLTLTAVVTDAKGKQIAPPAGNAPKNPDPKCASEVECRARTSHVVIAPGGKAHARVGFDANKVAWPKIGPTTCCTVHVDSVANGPLAAGSYKVKVPLPYEETQGNPADPEVTITVAGKAAGK